MSDAFGKFFSFSLTSVSYGYTKILVSLIFSVMPGSE